MTEYYNPCEECRALGDDYYYDDNGEMQYRCDDCMWRVGW